MLTSALEIAMKPNVGGDVYRVAFESANSELNEILGAFEELRSRKERIEKVVLALKPLLGAEEEAAAHNAADAISESADHSEEVPAYQYQAGNGSSADPFQRRVDSALGSKDARKVNRQF